MGDLLVSDIGFIRLILWDGVLFGFVNVVRIGGCCMLTVLSVFLNRISVGLLRLGFVFSVRLWVYWVDCWGVVIW